jgi:hypothetical protein
VQDRESHRARQGAEKAGLPHLDLTHLVYRQSRHGQATVARIVDGLQEKDIGFGKGPLSRVNGRIWWPSMSQTPEGKGK